MRPFGVVLVLAVYASVTGCIVFGAMYGLYQPKEIVGLASDSKTWAMLLGPFAALVWALNEPLPADNSGRSLFVIFSFLILALLAFAFGKPPLRTRRVAAAGCVWLVIGLLTYGFAHFVA